MNPRWLGELSWMSRTTVMEWLKDNPIHEHSLIKIERALSDFEQELLTKRRKIYGNIQSKITEEV